MVMIVECVAGELKYTEQILLTANIDTSALQR